MVKRRLTAKAVLRFAILAALPVSAALAARAEEPVTRTRFPDADTVVVNEIERVAYEPDGSYRQTDECWTKILTEKGRREAGTETLSYSKRYGSAGIAYVGAIDTNGCERAIDVSATTKESTDNGAMAVNIYDPLDRKIVCTIPGLKIGETLHVKTWRTAAKPRCRDKWADLSVMEWSCPIVASTYEVTAPAARPLKRIAVRHPLGNLVTNVTKRADGSLVHTFTVTNSAQVFPEPDMPPLHTQVQHVRVSTAEDWPEISRWYWELSAPHLAKTNAALVAKARELKDLRKIFTFVSQEVRYMGLTMEDTSPGYAPHDVDITFDNRYGVCRDKAGLLVAMLRAAGYAAYPVLIQVGAKLDPEVPQPFFNHAIVAVDRGDRTYELMDPTNENAKDLFPAYLNDKSYLVCRPDGEALKTSPIPSPAHNALDIVSKGTLAKDGSLFLENELAFGGINDTIYRHAFAKWKSEDRVKFFERVVKSVAAGAELVTCTVEPADMRDTERPIRVSLRSRLPEAVLRGETRDELSVPWLSQKLGMVNYLLTDNTALVQRKYPLVLESTARVNETLSVETGAALGPVAELPPAEETQGGYDYFCRFSATNGTLRATRRVEVSRLEFSPTAYGDLRENVKSVEAHERKRPAFARDPLKEADVRLLLDRSEATLFSDRDWVVTNTVVKEILTYDGKKRSAELKLAYNPTWKEVALVSATVSNRNGQVARVTEKEINAMDCGWAAKAPRYPAGKLLVVNLPSVEIGSVISYTVVTTVTNAPVGFYAAYAFDSSEPIGRRLVRVNGWQREVTEPKRLPNEPSQPAAALWRDVVIVASNRFETADLALGSVEPTFAGRACTVREIRDWMAKYVRVAGPALYETRLAAQLTDPETVLRERYASRLDYVRTLAALLRGAGFAADVVFAADNAGAPAAERERDKFLLPNVRAFAVPLCRVTERVGGFLGFGGETRTIFIGTENQYAELGASAYAGGDWYDPATGAFGIVTVPEENLEDFVCERTEYCVRDDGSVDLTVENEISGAGVGTFRKTYAEILPEERFRRYQAILGGIAQAATATGELETDVASYPAKRKFSCYIPDFATVQGDVLTLELAPLVSSLPALTGKARQTPFAIAPSDREREEVTVRFPPGFTEVEHVPAAFAFADPRDPSKVWMTAAVETAVVDGALAVKIVRDVRPRPASWYGAEFYELVKDWNRLASSRANRTVSARRKK